MTKNILITICLENDLIAPINKYEIPPHKLHIGYYETIRLLGENITSGPLISFLKSCYSSPQNKLSVIHIRDWHNAEDPEQKRELSIYGPHCMAGTWGAKFVWEDKHASLSENNKPYIINSKKIMTALEPEFFSTLNKIIGKTPKEDVKIGLIGVLTNIKVQQMAIALQQWMEFDNIAVCSALTASNNIRKHFQGLDDMKNIYGIKVFDSISSFSNWLTVDRKSSLKLSGFDLPTINSLDKEAKLNDKDKELAEYLFRECKLININKVGGGFSSSNVFLVQGIDKNDSVEVPNILKIDTKERIAKERVGFEKVEHILGSHVPKIVNSIEFEERGAIRYSFAMMNKTDKPKTFREFFLGINGSNSSDLKKLNKGLNMLFDEILFQLYSNYTFDQKQLWSSNTFLNDYEKIRKSLIEIIGYESEKDKILIEGIGEVYNPLLFYKRSKILDKMGSEMSYVRQSLAHGDLNAQNILLDSKFNMWLIDFFSTDYDYHIVQDLAQMEMNLKLLLTPINSKKDLLDAIELEKILISQRKLSESLPELPNNLAKNPGLTRLYLAIKKIRKFAYKVSQDNNIKHYQIPLLNYTGYAAIFPGASRNQRLFTLVSTSLLCEQLNT